jgi:hypothetical protein
MVILPHVVFPASMNYAMIMVVVGVVKKRKRWTNMNLNHCQTLLRCTLLTKPFRQAFTCKVLASMMNRHFELGIGAVYSCKTRFLVNNCQLEISLEISASDTVLK